MILDYPDLGLNQRENVTSAFPIDQVQNRRLIKKSRVRKQEPNWFHDLRT